MKELEKAALDERAEKESAERKLLGRNVLKREQEKTLQDRHRLQLKAREDEEVQRRRELERQRLEDETIAEERRRILEQHAPLLIGFLPHGIFRNLEEIEALPPSIQNQFQRHVRIQDDPDLW